MAALGMSQLCSMQKETSSSGGQPSAVFPPFSEMSPLPRIQKIVAFLLEEMF